MLLLLVRDLNIVYLITNQTVRLNRGNSTPALSAIEWNEAYVPA